MQSEDDQDLPGKSHNGSGQHRTEVPDAHNCFCDNIGSKSSHRSDNQEAYRDRHQKSQHGHEEKLHQIRNESVKQFLAFRSKIHHKDHRDHSAGIIHTYKRDPEKVCINRGFKNRSFKQSIEDLSPFQCAALNRRIAHNSADDQSQHRLHIELFRRCIAQEQRQISKESVADGVQDHIAPAGIGVQAHSYKHGI